MKYFTILVFIVIQSTIGQVLTKVSETPLDADSFVGLDSYNNIYFVKDGIFHKRGDDGNFIFNDYQLGEITNVDIINPLKIVAFYGDTNVAVLLDNKLSEIERINFNSSPIFLNLAMVTNAGNNKLWVFNIDSNQVELFDYRLGRTTIISQPLDGSFVKLRSDFNYCYSLTSSKLSVFNIYGSLLNENDLAFLNIAISDDVILGVGLDDLTMLTPSKDGSTYSVELIKKPLPENTIKELQLTQEFLYIYDGITIHTFSLTQPKQ